MLFIAKLVNKGNLNFAFQVCLAQLIEAILSNLFTSYSHACSSVSMMVIIISKAALIVIDEASKNCHSDFERNCKGDIVEDT